MENAMATPTRVISLPSACLRAIEFALCFIPPALIYTSDLAGALTSKERFVIFTAMSSFLICIIYFLIYITKDIRYIEKHAIIELIITSIWVVFWLTSGAIFSDHVAEASSYGIWNWHMGGTMLVCWACFALWAVSAAFCVLNIRDARRAGVAAMTQKIGTAVPDTNLPSNV